jgi:hypothetical protein
MSLDSNLVILLSEGLAIFEFFFIILDRLFLGEINGLSLFFFPPPSTPSTPKVVFVFLVKSLPFFLEELAFKWWTLVLEPKEDYESS